MTRQVEGFKTITQHVRRPVTIDPEQSPAGFGYVPFTLGNQVVAEEFGDEVIHKTVLTLSDLAQLIPNGASEWAGTQIYQFPAGRILVLGATASLAPKTTSTLASTITSGTTGTVALGTVTDDGTHTGTKADLLPDGNFTSSTVIDVAAAAVGKALAASAQFDGTSAAVAAFLNTKVATNTNDGTIKWSGTITLTWINLGDY